MTVRPMSRDAFLRTLEEEMRDAYANGWTEQEIAAAVEFAGRCVVPEHRDLFLSAFYQRKARLALARIGA